MAKLNTLFLLIHNNSSSEVTRQENYSMIRHIISNRYDLGINMLVSTLNVKRDHVLKALQIDGVPGDLDQVLEWAGYLAEEDDDDPPIATYPAPAPLVVASHTDIDTDTVTVEVTVSGKRIRVLFDSLKI